MLGNHEKDKNTLITTKAKLKVVNKELEEMRWSHEVLQQKYNQVSEMQSQNKTGHFMQALKQSEAKQSPMKGLSGR